MVNPDGVAAGNYRTNLFGHDVNRKWEGGKIKNSH
jgi:murein tripeptide amidase MpaA